MTEFCLTDICIVITFAATGEANEMCKTNNGALEIF
jgi:hypothetical protein